MNLAPTPVCQLDDFDLPGFTRLAADFGDQQYGFVVTPNVDHLIRLKEDSAFRTLYADAGFVLLDSRFLANILRFTRGLRFPVCCGSDLTSSLFANVIQPDDHIILIGGSLEQARQIRERFHLQHLSHFNPPMGFIRDPLMIEACLRFVEDKSPFRFCFLAVGSPQQEYVARQLKTRNIARGLALCVGASIDFLTGIEKRAPRWMQQLGIEWAYRLLQAPRRMASRYLVRGIRAFTFLIRAPIELRVNWRSIDTSTIIGAFQDIFRRKGLQVGQPIDLDQLREDWEKTGLRISDFSQGLSALRSERSIGAREPGRADILLRPAQMIAGSRLGSGVTHLLEQARKRRRAGGSMVGRRQVGLSAR